LFTGLLRVVRKGQDEGKVRNPKPVDEVPLVEGSSNQVDTTMIRTVPADVSRVQAGGTGTGGSPLIRPLQF
jgi:hypothetical protein